MFIINHVNPGLHSTHWIFLCRITVNWEESSIQQYRVCEMEKLIFKITENRGILNDSYLLWGKWLKYLTYRLKTWKLIYQHMDCYIDLTLIYTKKLVSWSLVCDVSWEWLSNTHIWRVICFKMKECTLKGMRWEMLQRTRESESRATQTEVTGGLMGPTGTVVQLEM